MNRYPEFKHLVDLRVPGFLRTVPAGSVKQLALEPRDSESWYGEFRDTLLAAIGRRYLPVFRVSDGEFVFSVGFRFPARPSGVPWWKHYPKKFISNYVMRRRNRTFLSGTPSYGYEQYTLDEWAAAQPRYVESVREIARRGILAVALMKTPSRFAQEYHAPMARWFGDNDVPLTPTNYFPFYFVYALLNGPDRRLVYEGRRILVVTSMDDAKQAAIGDGLRRYGARDVQFIRISRNKALLDRIDLREVVRPVDVVLIGAGVGASNILPQVAPLETLSIDAGYCIDLVAEPHRAGTRDFTISDEGTAGAAP